MNLEDKLKKVIAHKKGLEENLMQEGLPSDQMIKFSKELSDITPIVDVATLFFEKQKELADLEEMLTDDSTDQEMRSLANQEIQSLKESLSALEAQIKVLLLPKDEADEKNAILEIRAGIGGEEAALFGGVLLRMYQKYAEVKGWKFELLTLSDTDLKGVKEATASISGKNVFSRLKFESGVHRVQRVPETESQGRVHTSVATVAVLPEAEEIDVHIEEKDLRIDVFRSSGPGGQSVNTTDSAVRITHIPTGVVVQQQDEKSQHKNKAKALKILRSRLYEIEREKIMSERSENRKSQIGRGDRSERIRTYNFPQGRVTDHRINLTLYKIEQIINGEALDELIEALITEDQAEQLSSLE
jgi:peptide chain release factor 1